MSKTPLLLKDRQMTMEEQAMDSAWTNGLPGGLHICWVDTVGIDHPIPSRWRAKERVGCIVCESGDDEDAIADRLEDYRGFVLFEPFAFARAWAVARRLVKSHPGLCAQLTSWDCVGLHVIVAPFQRVYLDGQEVFR